LTNIIRHEFGQRGAAGLDFKAHPHMLRHACGFNAGHDTRVLRMLVLWPSSNSIENAVRARRAVNTFVPRLE